METETMTLPPEVYERGDGESVSETVIRAVADLNDVDPLDMNTCLYDGIDPAALERLCGDDCTGRDTETRVSFEFDGYWVTVDSAGTVFVTDHTECETPSDEKPSQAVLENPASSWRRAFQRL